MIEKIQTLLIVSGFASVCGALSYLLKVIEGKKFSWFELIVHSLISAMCGLITYQLLSAYGIGYEAAGALCGLSGWMGTRFLRILELVLINKTGVDANKVEQKK